MLQLPWRVVSCRSLRTFLGKVRRRPLPFLVIWTTALPGTVCFSGGLLGALLAGRPFEYLLPSAPRETRSRAGVSTRDLLMPPRIKSAEIVFSVISSSRSAFLEGPLAVSADERSPPYFEPETEVFTAGDLI